MVFQVVDQISKDNILTVFKFERFRTDTPIFRLHYKLTVWLVLLYSVCYMYILLANPISCVMSKEDCDCKKVVEDFCWVHGTFSILNTSSYVNEREMVPGIGLGHVSPNDEVAAHHYYKWMYFYIAFMIIVLQVPRQTWRFIEAGRMKSLVSELDWTVMVRSDKTKQLEENLVEYIYSHIGYQGRYGYGFVACELLNVFAISTFLYLWNEISIGQLATYGWSSFKYIWAPPTTRTDTLAKVFPLVAKCTFRDYGPGGSPQDHDALCILPLNVVNERAAVFFWCYFTILLSLGVLQILIRAVYICSKCLRAKSLRDRTPFSTNEEINLIVRCSTYSDWFIIYQLSHSLEPFIYKDVIKKLAERIRKKTGSLESV